MTQSVKFPLLWLFLLANILSGLAAILCGGFLIEASLFPFAVLDAFEGLPNGMSNRDQEDLNYLRMSCAVLGSLSIIFSLVFIWNSVELCIILCCGRQIQDFCLYDKQIKQELRLILNK